MHPLLLTTLAGLSTGLGGLIAALFRPGEKLLSVSAGFAGGVMLAASLADLVPGALSFYGAYLPPMGCGAALLTLLGAGMVLAALLGRLLPDETDLAVRLAGDTARTEALRSAMLVGTALLLHNFPEGVLTLFAGTADPALGLRTTLAIALHNIPEGLAVAVPFAFALNSRARGALAALLSGLAEPAGALLAYAVPGAMVHAGLSQRYGGAGGGGHALGGAGAAAARGPDRPSTQNRCAGHGGRSAADAAGHCGLALNVLYYMLYQC